MANDCDRRPVVLVIDDDYGVHAALQLILEEQYEVISAFGGAEGLQQVEQRRVDLVLLDLLMPRIDGWQVLEKLQKANAPRPRVVFLTGVDSSAAAVAAVKLGADDWIVKPFEEAALLMLLQSLLPTRRPVFLRGGELGSRASIAVILLTRCGIPVDYRASSLLNSHVLQVASGHHERELGSLLSRPPIGLTSLSPAIGAALYRVSRGFAESSVNALADVLELGSSYLSDRFRQEIGLSLGDYIARVRVEVIKQRLCQADGTPLDRLAEEVGFCHASHLSRVFARYANMSPGLYRRNMQRDRGNVH